MLGVVRDDGEIDDAYLPVHKKQARGPHVKERAESPAVVPPIGHGQALYVL